MKLDLVRIVVLVLSVVLQLISLVAPGWWIQSYYSRELSNTITDFNGIFYFVECNGSACKTLSWRDYYRRQTGLLKDWYSYNVQTQIFVIIAFVVTVLTLALFVARRKRPTAVSYLTVIISTCSCMLGSGALMIWQLSDYYIEIHVFKNRHTGDTIGFPYCVLLYSVALLANLAVFVIFVVEVVRSHRQHTSQEQTLSSTNNSDNSQSYGREGLYSRFS